MVWEYSNQDFIQSRFSPEILQCASQKCKIKLANVYHHALCCCCTILIRTCFNSRLHPAESSRGTHHVVVVGSVAKIAPPMPPNPARPPPRPPLLSPPRPPLLYPPIPPLLTPPIPPANPPAIPPIPPIPPESPPSPPHPFELPELPPKEPRNFESVETVVPVAASLIAAFELVTGVTAASVPVVGVGRAAVSDKLARRSDTIVEENMMTFCG